MRRHTARGTARAAPARVSHDGPCHYNGTLTELLSMRPGLSGAWAVHGRSRVGYPDRADIELSYDFDVQETGIQYRHVRIELDRDRRIAILRVAGPAGSSTPTIDEVTALGADWWPLAMARELDDAILHLRTNETALGLWLFETRGDAQAVLAVTSGAADVCRVGDRKGGVAPGFDADLLAVGGDPLVDIAALRDVVAVFRAGHRIR